MPDVRRATGLRTARVPAIERPRSATDVRRLAAGELEIRGRMPWSSNRTFLVEVRDDEGCTAAVYKPGRGERPLWDFPGGLYRREVAAWIVSEALGWGRVPETVLRDGPYGEGSVQRFVDADFEEHYFTLLEQDDHRDALVELCVFDLVINNADRKGGHCLLGEGRVWGVDHGLSFHVDPKLRTVIWDFAGEAVPASLRADVARLAASPPAGLRALLDEDEVAALVRRAEAVAVLERFPDPGEGYRPYPWPLV